MDQDQELDNLLQKFINLTLFKKKAKTLVQHRPGKVLSWHLSTATLTPAHPGLVQDTRLKGSMRAAEFPLCGGCHSFNHVHKGRVVTSTIDFCCWLFFYAFSMLKIIWKKILFKDEVCVMDLFQVFSDYLSLHFYNQSEMDSEYKKYKKIIQERRLCKNVSYIKIRVKRETLSLIVGLA